MHAVPGNETKGLAMRNRDRVHDVYGPMQRAPDRPEGFPVWAVFALVAVATTGGIWWILRSGPKPAPAPAASHAPCQPVSPTPSPAGTPAGSRTDEWEITVTSARAELSVPAQGGGTYRAAPREVFIVVDVSFRNLHPGTEASVSTKLARLLCPDGAIRESVGFDDGRGFCRVCALDLGTDQRRVRWSFIFRMDQTFLGQPFRFRYATAPPIVLSLTP